jgi:hypothetical protein
MFDALPLAGEPYAAALDLIFSCVSANFARVPSVALLRSPHFAFGDVTLKDIAALDRALSDAGYLGDPEALARALDGSTLRAGAALRQAVAALTPLREPAPVAAHLDVLLAFLAAHDRLPGPDDPLRVRQLRARAAIVATLVALRDAYRRFDAAPLEFDDVAAMVRRWVDAQTFAPRTGDSGVHVVDAASARYGDFANVQLAGLVDGEWPDRPARNIFYSSSILRELGWTAEAERADGARLPIFFACRRRACASPPLRSKPMPWLRRPASSTTSTPPVSTGSRRCPGRRASSTTRRLHPAPRPQPTPGSAARQTGTSRARCP